MAQSSADGTGYSGPAMPLEGHYKRQTTPLRKLTSRELKAAFGVLAVTLVAVIAVIALTAGDSTNPDAAGCTRSHVAGVVGSETFYACGQEAVQLCSRATEFNGARSETILADCKKNGIDF
jgi:hypothetical protein